MEEQEKKQYINVSGAIGIVFIIGVLLGNIIVSCMQEKEFALEPTTQQEESVAYLKKPQAIRNFLYEGIIQPKDNEVMESKPIENIDKPTTETIEGTKPNINAEESDEIIKESDEIEVEVESETTDTESTTKIPDEITETNESTKTETEVTEETTEETTKETTAEEEVTKSEPIINVDSYRCSLGDIYYTSPVRTYTKEQRELIAKMLFCEAGGEGWDCQVATCSAIINFIEHYGGDFSVLDNKNKFDPAPYYRYKTPTKTNYKVLDYVLSGHLIANIKYFRIYHYHNFGTPMFAVDNVYFSK